MFDLERGPFVMGVVNVTPDSFSDGGRFLDPSAALTHARALIGEGAHLVDLGAESTRPGAQPVSEDEQLRRLMPVVEGLAGTAACLSIDTSSAEVARRCLEAGAHVVNDVTALADQAMAGVVAESGAGLVLMHMRGTPATMQKASEYEDVAREVREVLAERVTMARERGIAHEAIAVDPGIGFGKTARHNFELIARLEELKTLAQPIVLGASRKSFIGKTLDLPVDQRLEGSLAAAAIGALLGADVIRAHDVRATVRALDVARSIREARRT